MNVRRKRVWSDIAFRKNTAMVIGYAIAINDFKRGMAVANWVEEDIDGHASFYMGKNLMVWLVKAMKELVEDEEKGGTGRLNKQEVDRLLEEYIIPWAEGRQFDMVKAAEESLALDWKKITGEDRAFSVINEVLCGVSGRHDINHCVHFAIMDACNYKGVAKRLGDKALALFQEYERKKNERETGTNEAR